MRNASEINKLRKTAGFLSARKGIHLAVQKPGQTENCGVEPSNAAAELGVEPSGGVF